MKKNIYLTWLLLFVIAPTGIANAQTFTIIDSVNTHISPYPLGLTWDGNGFWVSSQLDGKIYRLNLQGQKTDSIPDPSLPGSFSEGLAFDGLHHLWVTCFECDTLYQFNVTTKQIIAKVTGLPADERPSIAYDGNNTLYFADGSDGSGSYKMNISSQTITPWGPSTPFARGLTFVGSHLYGTKRVVFPVAKSLLTEFNPSTGDTISVKNWCVNDAFGGLAMTYDGQNIWQSNSNNSYIYKIAYVPPTGITAIQHHINIEMVQNPVSDKLLFINKTDGNFIQLYDMLGRIVFSTNLNGSASILLPSIENGSYFLIVFDKYQQIIGKQKVFINRNG